MKKNEFEIGDIEIAPVPPQKGLVAFASFCIDGCFFVGSIAIFTSPTTPGGFRLVYPTKLGTACFRPLNRQVGDAIQDKVIARYRELLRELLDNEEDLYEIQGKRHRT